jgi:HAD superfamily hydrolase (TIGR01450 family)
MTKGDCSLANRRDVGAVVIDFHGVMIRSDIPIPGAADAIRKLQTLGIPILFLSNTSARTGGELTRLINQQGIAASSSQVTTAGRLLARKLKTLINDEIEVVRFGGGSALAHEFVDAGIRSTHLHAIKTAEGRTPVALAAGFTRHFSNRDAQTLLDLAPRITTFVAAERDRWFAGEHGPTPGVGWVIAAAEYIVGRQAEIVGKPTAYPLEAISTDIGIPVSNIVLVGDSVESDIMAAKNAGAVSCLISSHTSSLPPLADYTIAAISGLPALISDIMQPR